jgi:hypothetical protein
LKAGSSSDELSLSSSAVVLAFFLGAGFLDLRVFFFSSMISSSDSLSLSSLSATRFVF